MNLMQAAVGDVVTITGIADPESAAVAIRLGIATGETLTLAAKVPGGPVVVRRGNVEIALGQGICRDIEVTRP